MSEVGFPKRRKENSGFIKVTKEIDSSSHFQACLGFIELASLFIGRFIVLVQLRERSALDCAIPNIRFYLVNSNLFSTNFILLREACSIQQAG